MLSRHIDEVKENIEECIDTALNDVVEIDIDDDERSIVAMGFEYYLSLLERIARNDKKLQDDIILRVGNQITGWDDVTADLAEAARYSNVSLELANQVVFHLSDVFSGSDGDTRVSMSPLGWEYYLELKGRDE